MLVCCAYQVVQHLLLQAAFVADGHANLLEFGQVLTQQVHMVVHVEAHVLLLHAGTQTVPVYSAGIRDMCATVGALPAVPASTTHCSHITAWWLLWVHQVFVERARENDRMFSSSSDLDAAQPSQGMSIYV